MVGYLHGYLLDGSGSNLFTRNVVGSLSNTTEVHLFSQDPCPEKYFSKGPISFHRPEIDGLLPVFVKDHYEGFQVKEVTEMSEAQINRYIDLNSIFITHVVNKTQIKLLIANHALLMPSVAKKVSENTGIPFRVMLHGSAMEYSVRKSVTLQNIAIDALEAAEKVFVSSPEMKSRTEELFGLEIAKNTEIIGLGVDTARFSPATSPSAIEKLRRSVKTLKKNTPSRIDFNEGNYATLKNHMAPDIKAPDFDIDEKLSHLGKHKIVTFVGRFIEPKAPHYFLLALPLLAHREFQTVMVGHGPLRFPLELFIEAVRSKNRIWAEKIWSPSITDPGAVRFVETLKQNNKWEAYLSAAETVFSKERFIMTGFLSHGQIEHLLAATHTIAIPSLVPEAGPMILLEALASGCTPIGTDHGGIAHHMALLSKSFPELQSGLLTRHTDGLTQDIAAKLSAALDSKLDSNRLHKEIESRFSWKALSQKLIEAS